MGSNPISISIFLMNLNVSPDRQMYYKCGVLAIEFAASVAQLAGIAGIKA